jgi:putative addiction module component (TIGR02574 family)
LIPSALRAIGVPSPGGGHAATRRTGDLADANRAGGTGERNAPCRRSGKRSPSRHRYPRGADEAAAGYDPLGSGAPGHTALGGGSCCLMAEDFGCRLMDMTEAARALLANALRLDEDARAEIAAELLASLDGPSDPDAGTAWAAEIDRRVSAIESGASVLESWQDVKSRIEKDILGR